MDQEEYDDVPYDDDVLEDEAMILTEESQKKDLGNELMKFHPEARIDTIESISMDILHKCRRSSRSQAPQCTLPNTVREDEDSRIQNKSVEPRRAPLYCCPRAHYKST